MANQEEVKEEADADEVYVAIDAVIEAEEATEETEESEK